MTTTLPTFIRIFVVGDEPFCAELRHLVEAQAGLFKCVGDSPSLAQAEPWLRRGDADLALVDCDGKALETTARSLLRSHAVLGVTSRDPRILDWAVLGGLRGVLRKEELERNCAKAIRKIGAGELWIDRVQATRLIVDVARRSDPMAASESDRRRIAMLTPRERQTIAALTRDAASPAKVIASRLRISENTLRNHLTSIYAKLQLQNRLDLYAFATLHGIDAESSVAPRACAPRPLPRQVDTISTYGASRPLDS